MSCASALLLPALFSKATANLHTRHRNRSQMRMRRGAFWGFLDIYPNVVSLANDELDVQEWLPITAETITAVIGLFSRPNSKESIIRSEEIRKHCK